MRAIETVHAEPRDLLEEPRYRVNFWQMTPGGAWALDAFVLTGASDITEVLRWVEDHVRDRRFEVFAEIDDEVVGSFERPRRTGLIQLAGSNPNESVTAQMGVFVKDAVPRTPERD